MKILAFKKPVNTCRSERSEESASGLMRLEFACPCILRFFASLRMTGIDGRFYLLTSDLTERATFQGCVGINNRPVVANTSVCWSCAYNGY